jgi:ATP-dependent Zn protease
VTMADLEAAKDLILMGGERSAAAFSEENRRLTAYHEGGHALVACLTDGALPVHKATIVPRGQVSHLFWREREEIVWEGTRGDWLEAKRGDYNRKPRGQVTDLNRCS